MQSIEEKLSSVAKIRTGYTFRERITNQPNGDIQVIQPVDLENGLLKTPIRLASSEISQLGVHLLKKCELLIANKGIRFATFLFENDSLPSIASASFFIITADVNILLPGFLKWFLSQEPSIMYLKTSSASTAIPSITKKNLEELKILIPPIEIQMQIVRMVNAVNRERKILSELIEKRDEYCTSYCWELIKDK